MRTHAHLRPRRGGRATSDRLRRCHRARGRRPERQHERHPCVPTPHFHPPLLAPAFWISPSLGLPSDPAHSVPSPVFPGLAGATSDVHSFDVRSGVWSKIDATGEGPSPRAAHSAAAVGNMVVVQGGIGPAGLASEDLHVLDLQGTPRWHRVVVRGPGPGQRYAHVISFVAQRFLVVHGGNDGNRPLGDSWCLDTTNKPYEWVKMNPTGDIPPPRMYAAAARARTVCYSCAAAAVRIRRPFRTRLVWRGIATGGGVGGGARGGPHRQVSTRRVLRRHPAPRQRRRPRRREHGGRRALPRRARHERRAERGMDGGGGSRGRKQSGGGGRQSTMSPHHRGRRPAGVCVRRFARGTLLGDMYVSEESPEESGASRAASVAALAEVIDFNAPAWRRWLRDVGLLEEAAKMADSLLARSGAEEEPASSAADGGGAKGVDGGAKGVGGAFGTPQGGSFNVGSPGSADGSPDNNLNQLAKLSSAEAQAAVALANRTNVDIDSPPESHGSGRNTRRRRREAPPGVRRLRRARRRLPTCGCITARWWWRRVWTGTPEDSVRSCDSSPSISLRTRINASDRRRCRRRREWAVRNPGS